MDKFPVETAIYRVSLTVINFAEFVVSTSVLKNPGLKSLLRTDLPPLVVPATQRKSHLSTSGFLLNLNFKMLIEKRVSLFPHPTVAGLIPADLYPASSFSSPYRHAELIEVPTCGDCYF